jgi:hypothetical protein
MGNRNSDLMSAQKKRDDEYYTLYEDIAAEIPKYKEQLKGKRIICPCDWDESFDEEIVYSNVEYVYSDNLIEPGGTLKEIDLKKPQKIIKNINAVTCNFIKFLIAHAESYQIQSITVSGYNPATGEGIKFQNIDYSKYDLVITNPPFSQIIDLFDIMFDYKLKFLVIGPQTAIGYKEAFKYIKTNQMWLGYAKQLTGFLLPDGTEILAKNPEGSVPRACKWFTNLDVSYRHDKMILTEKYIPEKYPKYYNYDAIDVSKTKDIPYDYEEKMGVPITFLQKYNPDQFEIIESNRETVKTVRWNGDKANLWIEKDSKPWKCPFERIIIRNKEVYHDED